ncbi:hypothetical protein I7I53_12194 [Histoplasma capsulatum var. duboisii H88]|uniref:Uncharacterized protein n=1 Tax=Ajellomyces capsulatus (strain H88) TaxID=544711 RepID=A0A8A1LUK3_AJEC8|nr:hypothetical protein I7I53_12194 [Histoplasma capsulatum var. duboisii H88]
MRRKWFPTPTIEQAMTKTLFAEESSDLSFRAPDLSLASRYRQPDSYGDPSWERVVKFPINSAITAATSAYHSAISIPKPHYRGLNSSR